MTQTGKIKKLLKKLIKNVNVNVRTNSEADQRVLQELLQAHEKARGIERPAASIRLRGQQMLARGRVWKIAAMVAVAAGIVLSVNITKYFYAGKDDGRQDFVDTEDRAIATMDDDGTKAPKTVTVLVAAKDLPAATLIDASLVVKKEVPRAELSAAKLADGVVGQASAIGRVLGTGVVKDTILTEACFLPRGSFQDLIARIPPGKRAFTINLRSGTTDLALLRPGSRVDVYSITRLPREQRGETVATYLLRNILVLAVQGQIVRRNPNSEGNDASRGTAGDRVNVTLQVTNQQAAALELAQQRGEIAFALGTRPDPNEQNQRVVPIVPRRTRKVRMIHGGKSEQDQVNIPNSLPD